MANKIKRLEAEVDQLRRENALLRQGRPAPAFDSSAKVSAHLLQLKQLIDRLQSSVDAQQGDQALMAVMLDLYQSYHKTTLKEDLDVLLNPYAQARLANLGYAPTVAHEEKKDLKWLQDFFTRDGTYSEAQQRSLCEIFAMIKANDEKLRQERVRIDKEIKRFYFDKLKVHEVRDFCPRDEPSPPGALEMLEMIEFAKQLGALKQNFITSHNSPSDYILAAGAFLTPLQHAKIVLQGFEGQPFDWPKHVQAVQCAWQIFTEKNQSGLDVSSLVM